MSLRRSLFVIVLLLRAAVFAFGSYDFGPWPAGKSPDEIGHRVAVNIIRRPHMQQWEDTVIH